MKRTHHENLSSAYPSRKRSQSSTLLTPKDSVDSLSSQMQDLVSSLSDLLSRMIEANLKDRVLVSQPSQTLEGLANVSQEMSCDRGQYHEHSFVETSLRQEGVESSHPGEFISPLPPNPLESCRSEATSVPQLSTSA